MDEIKPAHHVTKEECREMIDAAMRRHNRNASLISIGLGTIALVGYADGMIRILEKVQ
jgi:predicted nucleic acid-binding Zn ribbon protein|tara:strand:- start:50 stop:223 length:174 start_codon:yes stop_codon:yes gene_type:complete